MWISRKAVSWSTESVDIERTSVMSSAIPAMCGTSSLSTIPDWPCGRNRNGEASRFPACVLKWISSWPGYGLPWYFVRAGLGSNRSIWLGPPCWNRQMTDLACGFEAATAPAGGARSARHGSPARAALLQQVRQGQRPDRPGIMAQERAAIESRRATDRPVGSGSGHVDSLDIEERVAGQQHLAEVGPGAAAGGGRGQAGVSGGLRLQEPPGRVALAAAGPGRDPQEGPAIRASVVSARDGRALAPPAARTAYRPGPRRSRS